MTRIAAKGRYFFMQGVLLNLIVWIGVRMRGRNTTVMRCCQRICYRTASGSERDNGRVSTANDSERIRSLRELNTLLDPARYRSRFCNLFIEAKELELCQA